MARRRHRKLETSADLDITAFMNLMIVLVPVLLLNMVFEHTKVLELNFPSSPELQQKIDDLKEEQLQVLVRANSIDVASNKAGILTRLEKDGENYDFKGLSEFLKQVKARLPEKTDISILLEPEIDYQALVTTMDTVRSYKTVLVASVVDAELFPDISIGDAPIVSSDASSSKQSLNQSESAKVKPE